MVHFIFYILHIIHGQNDCGQTEFTENTGTISWVFTVNIVNIVYILYTTDDMRGAHLLRCLYFYLKSENPLSSPGFPQNYPNGVNCVYRIVAAADVDVILTFVDLDIENDAQCRWDSLAINFQFSGQSNTVCGNLVNPNGFTANPLTGVGPVSLTMTADDGVNGRGFQINYEIINPDPCIGGGNTFHLQTIF